MPGGLSPGSFSAFPGLIIDKGNHAETLGVFHWAGLKAAFTFQKPITEGLGVTDWKASLFPKLNGKPLPLKDEATDSLAILPDRSGFLLGTAFNLYLFDPTGKVTWRVPLHTPALVVNTNGKVALAGLADGTIRWYRLADGKEILALFPHPDRKRWVLWTPSGYYHASPGGEDFIGWHVNNGKDQAADFFPISRFRSTYHRPDVIDHVLKTLDELAMHAAEFDGGFDAGCSFHVLEHLPDPPGFIGVLRRCLRPGGSLYLAVPNRIRSGRATVEPLDSPPHHLTRWSPESLADIVRRTGLVPTEIATEPVDISIPRDRLRERIRSVSERIPIVGGILGIWLPRAAWRVVFCTPALWLYRRYGLLERGEYYGLSVAVRCVGAGS